MIQIWPLLIGKGSVDALNIQMRDMLHIKKLSPSYKAFVKNLYSVKGPESIHKALTRPEWKKALEEGVWALEHNNTWVLTELLPSKNPVGCKWILNVKYKAIDRFQSLVATNGYLQCRQITHCLLKRSEGKRTILIVYADDIILTRDDSEEILSPKGLQATEFEIKDLGKLRF